MARKVKKSEVNFKGKTVSIGIDMHKRSWHITALVEGDVVLGMTLSSPSYTGFKRIFGRFTTCVSKYTTCGPVRPIRSPLMKSDRPDSPLCSHEALNCPV